MSDLDNFAILHPENFSQLAAVAKRQKTPLPEIFSSLKKSTKHFLDYLLAKTFSYTAAVS